MLAAIQQGDRDRLRDLVTERKRDSIREEDLDELATCVSEGVTLAITGREYRILGDRGKVTLQFEVTQSGETTTVEDSWDFERQEDGTWPLGKLPRCPIREPRGAPESPTEAGSPTAE